MATDLMGQVPKCRDCGVELQPIRLLDATVSSPGRNGRTHVDLNYASPDAKPSFFMGTIPAAGIVKGMVCPECGLVQLYAVPKS